MGLHVGANMRPLVNPGLVSLSLHDHTTTRMDLHQSKKRKRQGKKHDIMLETDLVDAQEIVTVLQPSRRAMTGFIYKDTAIPMHETNIPSPPTTIEVPPVPDKTQEQYTAEIMPEEDDAEAPRQRLKVYFFIIITACTD